MLKKEVCSLCTEYDFKHKCAVEKNCKLISLWKENKELKNELSKTKKKLDVAEAKMSYMINPNAIGNRW